MIAIYFTTLVKWNEYQRATDGRMDAWVVLLGGGVRMSTFDIRENFETENQSDESHTWIGVDHKEVPSDMDNYQA